MNVIDKQFIACSVYFRNDPRYLMGFILQTTLIPIAVFKDESKKRGTVYEEIRSGSLRWSEIRKFQKEVLGLSLRKIFKNAGDLDTVLEIRGERMHVAARGGWEGIVRPQVEAYRIPAQVYQS